MAGIIEKEFDFQRMIKSKAFHCPTVHEGVKPFKCHICQYRIIGLKSHLKTHITSVHEKKKNENKMSKSGGHRNNQEVSFQCIKVEASTLEQSQPSETVDPLLIHEFKEENFEENEATPIEDLTEVYIKQEVFGAPGYQDEQENGMIVQKIKEEFVLGE